jgi:hypothetical protein
VLKGAEVRIPAHVFNIEAEDVLFTAVVVGRDNTHAGCLTVRFKHWRERFFFPLEQVRGARRRAGRGGLQPRPGARVQRA